MKYSEFGVSSILAINTAIIALMTYFHSYTSPWNAVGYLAFASFTYFIFGLVDMRSK